MFDKLNTLDDARAMIRGLTVDQLSDLTIELTVAWMSGQVPDQIAVAVALLIEESAIERLDAELAKEAGATIN